MNETKQNDERNRNMNKYRSGSIGALVACVKSKTAKKKKDKFFKTKIVCINHSASLYRFIYGVAHLQKESINAKMYAVKMVSINSNV